MPHRMPTLKYSVRNAIYVQIDLTIILNLLFQQQLVILNLHIIARNLGLLLNQNLRVSNSFELLTGPIDIIQNKYEILSDIVIEVGGKTYGSQSLYCWNKY